MAAGSTVEHTTHDAGGPRARGALAFGVLITLAFLMLAARLAQLQIVEYRNLATEAARQLYGVVKERDRRGGILDSRGRVLATSVAVAACALDPKVLLEAEGGVPEKVTERLKDILGLTPADIQRIAKGLEKRRVVDGPEGPVEEPVRFVWVKRRLTEEEGRRLSAEIARADREASEAWRNRRRWLRKAGEMKVARDEERRKIAQDAADGWKRVALEAEGRYAGVFFPPEYERVYPQGRLASHILGFGDIDGQGLEGVEKTCETLLRGTSLDRVVARDARSRALSTLVSDDRSTDGMTVELTIDSVVQAIVEEELEQGVNRLKTESPEITAHAVVMDPFTGDILAIANYPTFDPNHPADYDPRNRRNDVVAAVQEPGSTFKPLLISASIEEKLADFEEIVDCASFRMENGRTIKDIHPYGRMSLQMAVVKSSNPAMVRVGLRLGPAKMREYVLKYGFGEKTGSMLPGEVAGKVTSLEKWSSYTMGSVPMGYEINVTSLQMAAAYSVIANGGLLFRPNIVKTIRDANGGLVLRMQPEVRRRVISENTAKLMRQTLRRVVTEGTGRRANIGEYELGGKTGTANMIANEKERAAGIRGYSKKRHTANFVALAPWDRPKAVICVSIRETGKYGGEAASPVVAGISRRLLGYWGVPTGTGEPVKADLKMLENYDPPPPLPMFVVGDPDDDNFMREEVDPRLWEEWVEEAGTLG